MVGNLRTYSGKILRRRMTHGHVRARASTRWYPRVVPSSWDAETYLVSLDLGDLLLDLAIDGGTAIFASLSRRHGIREPRTHGRSSEGFGKGEGDRRSRLCVHRLDVSDILARPSFSVMVGKFSSTQNARVLAKELFLLFLFLLVGDCAVEALTAIRNGLGVRSAGAYSTYRCFN